MYFKNQENCIKRFSNIGISYYFFCLNSFLIPMKCKNDLQPFQTLLMFCKSEQISLVFRNIFNCSASESYNFIKIIQRNHADKNLKRTTELRFADCLLLFVLHGTCILDYSFKVKRCWLRSHVITGSMLCFLCHRVEEQAEMNAEMNLYKYEKYDIGVYFLFSTIMLEN